MLALLIVTIFTHIVGSGELIMEVGVNVNAEAVWADITAIFVPEPVGGMRVDVTICGRRWIRLHFHQ
jgi:hypothetical protein